MHLRQNHLAQPSTTYTAPFVSSYIVQQLTWSVVGFISCDNEPEHAKTYAIPLVFPILDSEEPKSIPKEQDE
jgi:hypothetical protein